MALGAALLACLLGGVGALHCPLSGATTDCGSSGAKCCQAATCAVMIGNSGHTYFGCLGEQIESNCTNVPDGHCHWTIAKGKRYFEVARVCCCTSAATTRQICSAQQSADRDIMLAKYAAPARCAAYDRASLAPGQVPARVASCEGDWCQVTYTTGTSRPTVRWSGCPSVLRLTQLHNSGSTAVRRCDATLMQADAHDCICRGDLCNQAMPGMLTDDSGAVRMWCADGSGELGDTSQTATCKAGTDFCYTAVELQQSFESSARWGCFEHTTASTSAVCRDQIGHNACGFAVVTAGGADYYGYLCCCSGFGCNDQNVAGSDWHANMTARLARGGACLVGSTHATTKVNELDDAAPTHAECDRPGGLCFDIVQHNQDRKRYQRMHACNLASNVDALLTLDCAKRLRSNNTQACFKTQRAPAGGGGGIELWACCCAGRDCNGQLDAVAYMRQTRTATTSTAAATSPSAKPSSTAASAGTTTPAAPPTTAEAPTPPPSAPTTVSTYPLFTCLSGSDGTATETCGEQTARVCYEALSTSGLLRGCAGHSRLGATVCDAKGGDGCAHTTDQSGEPFFVCCCGALNCNTGERVRKQFSTPPPTKQPTARPTEQPTEPPTDGATPLSASLAVALPFLIPIIH